MSELNFKEVNQHVTSLKSDWALRDKAVREIERIFLLDDPELLKSAKKVTNAMITKSPDGRNQALGAVRLMTGANPQWDVPENMNTPDVMEQSGHIASICDRLWRAASRASQDPVHYDEVLSLILWAESHMIIDQTKDLVTAAGSISSAAEARAQEIAYLSPIMFTSNHPLTGYPELDKMGMSAYYSETDMTVRDFLGEFGQARGEKMLSEGGSDPTKLLTMLTVSKYLDYVKQYIWFKKGGQGTNKGFAEVKDHGFPVIPVIYTRGEGSRMFKEPHHQNQSFLYTMYKSGMWNRANLVLTIAYTMVFALGSSPMFKEKLNSDGKGVTMKQFGAARKAVVPDGADFDLMNLNNLLNKDLLGLLELAERKIEESTLYSQTLGEALGSGTPFSTMALLHQAGRLPLVTTQRKGSWGISDAMKRALKWLKAEPPEMQYPHIFGKNQQKALENIPDNYELEAKLGLDLPEDLSENVRNATAMREDHGSGPLMTDKWIRENIMREADPDQMQKDIWTEQALTLKQQEYMHGKLKQQIMMEIEEEALAMQEAEGGGDEMPPRELPPGSDIPPDVPPTDLPPGTDEPPLLPPEGEVPAAPGNLTGQGVKRIKPITPKAAKR